MPIEPYFNTSVLIGIGQRYNVIVEANPLAGDSNEIPDDGNFWIRTYVADGCGIKPQEQIGEGYEQTGILRYNPDSTAAPTSKPWRKISKACSDETYTSLRPKIPWFVGPAANSKDFSDGEVFNVTFDSGAKNRPSFKDYPLATFSLQPAGDNFFTPLQINYSDPIIMHLGESKDKYPPRWVVVSEDYSEEQWVC